MLHNYWACALEPGSQSYWAHTPQVLNPKNLGPVCALQQEATKVEVHASRLESSPHSPTTRENAQAAMKTQHSQQ